MAKGKSAGGRRDKTAADWDGIVAALETWRQDSRADTEPGDPSVTTVAERHRRDPWAVLSSTILSLRTKDEVTLVRSQALLGKAPTPQKLLSLSTEEIEKLIYPVGFYHTKARNLQKIAAILVDAYQGQVPSDMEALLSLPGVGRKTANLTLTEGFDMDGICVDVHVHRITNRLGALRSKTPEETEMLLREILPKKYWKRINLLLVLYGQRVCRPVSPFCSRCVLARHCERAGVERSR
ncbi:MAG: endonuclease III [Treponema sp.]|jgi:endonuclease-3|nr:endonuclease III [Treponema sp.]